MDARGLTLVLSDKPDVERDAVASAWSTAGGEVLRLARFWEPPPLPAPSVRLYGAETFCQVVAQKLELELLSPPDDLLLRLPESLARRALIGATLADAARLSFPRFVKSAIPKLIPSRVYSSVEELEGVCGGLEADVLLITSEVVEIVAEARSWVLDGEVAAIACYEGAADLAGARALAVEAGRDTLVPRACVVDLGLVPNRGWVVVEANAAWGAGLNGCDPAAVLPCIEAATQPCRASE